jgi:hypothetical protein
VRNPPVRFFDPKTDRKRSDRHNNEPVSVIVEPISGGPKRKSEKHQQRLAA